MPHPWINTSTNMEDSLESIHEPFRKFIKYTTHTLKFVFLAYPFFTFLLKAFKLVILIRFPNIHVSSNSRHFNLNTTSLFSISCSH
ncbi:hypothetical protein AQUCO_01200098v1 [Aquilegia coerulea]|uniref:Uncharacterized protein n=1 Tax=Aquilegia coerulea TaxID=218851 RepID=A0A2G5E4D9_AQUCA|nr:hypothetical protein AQUCO_01200098v1 [Aquilegia coerulea]